MWPGPAGPGTAPPPEPEAPMGKAPRTRRSEPAGTAPKERMKPGKAQAKKAASAPEEPGPRVAPTPVLDTHEGRRRARAVVGLGLVAVVALAGLLLARTFRTDDPEDFEEIAQDAPPVAGPATPDRAALEREASVALADARRAVRQRSHRAPIGAMSVMAKDSAPRRVLRSCARAPI